MSHRERSTVKHWSNFSVLLGVAVLVLGAAVYLRLMRMAIGPVSLFARSSATLPFRVALLNSRVNQGKPDREQRWREALQSAAIPYQEVAPQALTSARVTDGVLILPAAACLSESNRQFIRDFLKSGSGVVASGELGTRDEGCAWLGWDFQTELTGLSSPKRIPAPGPTFAGFAGERFFSAKIAAGATLALTEADLVVGQAESPDLFWSDWRLRPVQASSLQGAALGIHRTVGQGRIVWFGLEEASISNSTPETIRLNSYLSSAVRWAARQPLLMSANWPGGKSAAAIISDHSGAANKTFSNDALESAFRNSATDVEVISAYRGPLPWGDDLMRGFLDDLERSKQLRGIYALSFQNELLGSPANRHILQHLQSEIKAQPVWMASPDQLTAWSRARDRVRLEVDSIASNQIRVAVTNPDDKNLEGLNADLYLPGLPRSLRVRSTSLGQGSPRWRLLANENVVRFDFETLKGLERRIYIVSLDDES